MAGRIAVTPRSLSTGDHPALQPLRDRGYEVVFPSPGRVPTAAEQEASIPSCVGYLAGIEPIPGALLRKCPDLRVISRNGVGVDSIDLAAAADLGVEVLAASGANAQGVAELAVTLMLALCRGVVASDAAIKSGGWVRKEGREVLGRTLGVVGYGQIGRRVAGLGQGLGMKVVVHDAFQDVGVPTATGERRVSLSELASTSDVISLHCPPGELPLVDDRFLRLVTPGALLVNTARSGLVDLDSVESALVDGRLAGFATDVYPSEPPARRPLWSRPDVVCTPHSGGHTAESVARAAEAGVDNLLRILTGGLREGTV